MVIIDIYWFYFSEKQCYQKRKIFVEVWNGHQIFADSLIQHEILWGSKSTKKLSAQTLYWRKGNILVISATTAKLSRRLVTPKARPLYVQWTIGVVINSHQMRHNWDVSSFRSLRASLIKILLDEIMKSCGIVNLPRAPSNI